MNRNSLLGQKSIWVLFSIILFLPSQILQAEERIAVPLLREYVSKMQLEESDKTGAYFLLGTGATIGLTGGALLLWGDAFTWDDTTRYVVSGSLIGTGAVTFGIGTALLLAEPRDIFQEYASVFQEGDPKVQEALAIGALQSNAQTGKNNRITGAFVNMALPFIFSGIQIGTNLGTGKEWYNGLFPANLWQIWFFVGGIQDLVTPSYEEEMWDRYMMSKQALQ